MTNLEQYVGRKVKGVAFVLEQYRGILFNSEMNKFIGCEGVIREYCEGKNSFNIAFEYPENDSWYYPAELILPQLEKPQLEKEIIGYTINDEKYIKIIASLCGVQESNLSYLKGDNTHFSVNSEVEKVVKKYDLLDKCTPVYVNIIKLPKINGYEGEDMGDYLQYGCAKLLKSWFVKSSNRSIKSMTLDSGVVINEEQMSEIRDYLDSSKK